MSRVDRALLLAVALASACRSRLLDDPVVDPDAGPAPIARDLPCPVEDEAPAICPMGEQVVLAGDSPVDVRIDAHHVAVTTSEVVQPRGPTSHLDVAPLDGGPPTTRFVYGDEANQFAWALRGGAAFLSPGSGVYRVGLDDGTTQLLYAEDGGLAAWRVATDDEAVYVGVRDNRAGSERVLRIPRDGGDPTTLAELHFQWDYLDDSPNTVVELAVDACHVYWVHPPTIPSNGGSNRDGALLRVAKRGGAAPEVLLDHLESPGRIALGNAAVHVVDHIPGAGYDLRLVGVAKDGRALPTIEWPGDTQPSLWFADDTSVYTVRYQDAQQPEWTGWWSQPLDGSRPAALVPSLAIAPGINPYGAYLDRRCRLLYEIDADETKGGVSQVRRRPL